MPIPIRAREVFPSVNNSSSHPLYNNYMFGASNGSKVKNNNRKKKKKRSLNSSAEYGRSVAQDSESSASAY
jgi:Tfp pilus assembly protein FimT